MEAKQTRNAKQAKEAEKAKEANTLHKPTIAKEAKQANK